jgi:hypothetical protein
MSLYLVGKFVAVTEQGTAWEFQGVFDTKAVAACRTKTYFIAPIVEPDESLTFEGAEYPLATL